MSLGDSFPDDFKQNFAKRNIDLGSSILIKVNDFDVNYDKYVIIVSESSSSSQLAYVVINSDINENVFYTKYLKSLNVQINSDNHTFLEKDSYIDCSKIREFDLDKVLDYLQKYPENAVGNVEDKILKNIHITITHANTIAKFLKKKYGFI